MRKFRNRSEAGRILAERVARTVRPMLKPGESSLVLALPRGGVPIAREVAAKLGARFDVLAVRKIGAPGDPELGIGAITESGYFWVNPDIADAAGVAPQEMEREITVELEEVRRQAARYREGRVLPDLTGRTVVVVDDGIATGATAIVAARFLRSQGAARVILAAPVCARDTLPLLESEADQVVCARAPEAFSAVGLWYEDFSQIGDDEVIGILQKEREEERGENDHFHLDLPGSKELRGIVLFAHGSGSSRFSPRNRRVAKQLNEAGFGTLLFDLLTPEEEANRERVFDIPFLARRLSLATRRTLQELSERGFPGTPIGYFGASTGAAAALWAAADPGNPVRAIVSRGGRPDLAAPRLDQVSAPTLLIVGSEDHPVIEMNERALRPPNGLPNAEMVLVEGATHLFEEPGALDEVARHAIRWYESNLKPAKASGPAQPSAA